MQERTCADCGVDISARHGNAKRCVGCSRRVSAEIQRNRPPREVRRRGVELDERVCTACRATFMPRRESQQTCSNRCYMWTQRHPTDERRTSQTCAGCANVFIPTHQAQFYCSPRCSAAASKRRTRKNVRPYIRYATCVTCGADLPADQKAGTKYCSATCGRRDRRGEAERMAALTERSCAYCGTVFMPRNWRGVTCSRRCSSMWHYIQNKDLYSRRAMAYMETHRARYREMAREWRRANIEQRRALERAYYAANRERFAVHLQKRRASKVGNRDSVGVALRDWLRLIARQRGICAYCQQPTTEWHMEHVIPLSRGGRHAIGNIAATCPACNLSKHNSLLIEWRYRDRSRRAG